MENKRTATEVAAAVGVSVRSMMSWYRWQTLAGIQNELPEDCPRLPKYEQAYQGAPRFWSDEDIEMIKKFHEWMPKGRAGVMGNINARHWGERGRRALANKSLKKDE